MHHVTERFEVIVDVKTTLTDLTPISATDHWPLGRNGSRDVTPAAIAEFNAREQRLFDAIRRHGPSLDAWLTYDAIALCVYMGLEDVFDWENLEESWERLIGVVPESHREGVARIVRAPDSGPMPHFSVYHAPTAKILEFRMVPHAPPSRLEGLAPLPVLAWHHCVFTVEASTNDLEAMYVERSWENLTPELRAYFGSLDRLAGHLRVMNEAAVQDPVVRGALFKARVMSSCGMPDKTLIYGDALIDDETPNRVLRDRIATLPAADRGFYDRFPDKESDDFDDDRLALYEVTFGISRATRSDAEAFRMRAVV